MFPNFIFGLVCSAYKESGFEGGLDKSFPQVASDVSRRIIFAASARLLWFAQSESRWQ
jgi:hypothetical protein